MNAAVKCESEVDEVIWTEPDGSIISSVAHQSGASHLHLKDFIGPVVTPAIPNRPGQHDPAEYGLSSPRHDFVRIRAHRPVVRKADFRANHEVGDLTECQIGPLNHAAKPAAAVIQAVANVHIEKRREAAPFVFKTIVKVIGHAAGAESLCGA